MDKKLVRQYLLITFGVMLVSWGLCVVCGLNGMTFKEFPLLYLPYMIGGWSPTIASFAVLRRLGAVHSFRNWLGHIFDWRQSWKSYLLVFLFAAGYILPLCLVSGYTPGAPWFVLPLLVPLMLLGGGLEEAGWRHILQPELEKQYPFIPAVLITALVWWLWHLPLFFIPDVVQYGQNYAVFGLNVLGLSFALAAIRKTTGSVWLCILFHCLDNALSAVFVTPDSFRASALSAAVLIGASLILTYRQGQGGTHL